MTAHGIVTTLLEKNVDVNSKDDFERVPLHYACWSANSAVVSAFIKHGAYPDTAEMVGRCPLYYACEAG